MISESKASSDKGADIDIIVLSDSDDDIEASDNGSCIQPIRAHKRPVSAISSDSSSLDLHSGSSSANGHSFMSAMREPAHNQPSRMPSLLPNPSSQSLFTSTSKSDSF